MNIETAHYLVHVWFDRWEHIGFTKKVLNKISEIKDRTHDILVFVDSPIFSKEEIGLMTVIKLAWTVTSFLDIQHNISRNPPLEKSFIEYLEENYPKEIILDLYDFFKDTYELIRRPIPLIQHLVKNKIAFSSTEQDLEIKKQVKEYDKYYLEAFSKHFLSVLKKLEKKYKRSNIYDMPELSDENKFQIPDNSDRRQKIWDYALENLWENRIINGYMSDGDEYWWKEKYKDENNSDNQELGYWNAEDYVLDLLMKFDEISMWRDRKEFFDNLRKNNFEITDRTIHILWWEYLWCCVNNFWTLLSELYGFPESKVFCDDSISLKK